MTYAIVLSMNRILRYIVIAGVFIIPFTPLLVTNSFFFPFITGKNFFFRILVELIFGAWLILALTYPAYRPKRSWLLWTLVAFVAVMTLADLFSANPYKSIWSNYERMEGLVSLLHLFAYFLVASTVLRGERIWNWLWNTSIFVSIIIAVYGFYQLSGVIKINQGGVRIDATFGNATYLAVYMLFHIFLTAYIVASNRHALFYPFVSKLYKAIVGAIIIVVQGIILYHTATRGAILGLIGGVLLTTIIIALFERRNRYVRVVSIGVLVAAIVVVVGFLSLRQSTFVQKSPVLSRFASISLSETTTKSRFIIWNMAWQGFKERPILGWGQESFNFVFNKYYNPHMYNQEQWFDRTHNVILDWLIAGGILGLGTYLAFYIALVWFIWRREGDQHIFTVSERAILTGLLFGYFIHNLFVFDNLISYILFFSLAAYVSVRNHHLSFAGDRDVVVENRMIAPVAVVLTAVLIYVVNVQPIRANITLIQAIIPHTAPNTIQLPVNAPFNGDATQNLDYFRKVFALRTFGTSEAREQLIAASEQVIQSQFPINAGQDLVNLAIDEMNDQIKRVPNDARFRVLLGSFLSHAGKTDDALVQLKEAEKLSPQKQAILFELGAAYVGKKNYADAEKYFKKAFELDQTYDMARLLYAAGAVYAGHNSVADNLIKDMPKKDVIESDYLVQAYYTTGQKAKFINVWKERVKLNPTDLQTQVSLAAAYLYTGDRTTAIAELEKAIKLHPEFKEQGTAFIQEIRTGKNP
jgi:O-antigen ligase/tetratricopeptide (TPR) repeat protein